MIYALADPYTGEIRYVGKTKHSPDQRLKSHMHRARKGVRTHTSAWIRSLSERPTLLVLEADPVGGDSAAECAWIACLRRYGARLTNHTDGGEGRNGDPNSPEARAKVSAALKGITRSPETRAKIAAWHRGRQRSAEARAKMSASAKKRRRPPLSLEHRAKISASLMGHGFTPEVRAKMSATQKARYEREGQSGRLRAL